MSSRTFEVEGPIIVAFIAKIEGGGRGIVVIKASINKVEIPIFIGMKIPFLLKQAAIHTITSRGVIYA